MTSSSPYERLTATDLAEARALATREAERFRGRAGWYGANGFGGHLTGKLGEWAVFQWARRLGIPTRGLFRAAAATKSADVLVADVPIEVKSYRTESWNRLGGCVSTYQLESVLTKAALVIFCRVSYEEANPTVEIVGWIEASNVPVVGVAALDRSYRANIRVPEREMNPVWPLAEKFSDIADGLVSAWQPPGTRADAAVSSCVNGHRSFYGHCWGCDVTSLDTPEWVIVGDQPHHRMHSGAAGAVKQAHGGWPFRGMTRRLRFVDVVWRHPPCWYCFGQSTEAADLSGAISEPAE
jgi:hypothetical protein